jgi:hypothetical protein
MCSVAIETIVFADNVLFLYVNISAPFGSPFQKIEKFYLYVKLWLIKFVMCEHSQSSSYIKNL